MKPRTITTDVQDGKGKWGIITSFKGSEFLYLTDKILKRSIFLTEQEVKQFNYLNFIHNPHL